MPVGSPHTEWPTGCHPCPKIASSGTRDPAQPQRPMINPIEADFLTHCIDVWCNELPQIAGRPVMFTTQEGGYEKVLLTHDQIESLFLRLQALK